jgi:hypothetical protein
VLSLIPFIHACFSFWVNLEFCHYMYNQRESFVWIDLMVKNRERSIKKYFKWCTNIKLV